MPWKIFSRNSDRDTAEAVPFTLEKPEQFKRINMIAYHELIDLWRKAGGEFHGPNVETGTMPESQLLPFLQALVGSEQNLAQLNTRIEALYRMTILPSREKT